ncbi:hypothetical protein [Moorena sp. SIO1F2]|uniref:hypothetical protein n=1 Tax=Moorena sp. SIO1F2 TaxID=2607819 RepID=UPI0025FEBF01|nr:hypothetical protein [Moorena sp. SIO1F2]
MELASCQFHAYFRAGRMPNLLLFIPKFSNAENPSLLPTPYSLLPTPYSLLPTPYSLLPTPYSH